MKVHIKQWQNLIKRTNGSPFYLRFFEDKMDIQVSKTNVMKFASSEVGSVDGLQVDEGQCAIFPILDPKPLTRPLDFFGKNSEFLVVKPSYFKEETEDGHKVISHLNLIGVNFQQKVNGTQMSALFYRADNKVKLYLDEENDILIKVGIPKDKMEDLIFALGTKMKTNHFLFTVNEKGIHCNPAESEAVKWEYDLACHTSFSDGYLPNMTFNVPTDTVKHLEAEDATFYFKQKGGASWLAIIMETSNTVCPVQVQAVE